MRFWRRFEGVFGGGFWIRGLGGEERNKKKRKKKKKEGGT